MGDDQMVEQELQDASTALRDPPARPPTPVSALRTRFAARRRRQRALATAAAALLLLGAGGAYAAIRRSRQPTATEQVQTADTTGSTSAPNPSGLTAADVRALTILIERGTQADWNGHVQVTRAEAVLTTQTEAMRVAGEPGEHWDGATQTILLVEYGRFPAPSGPPGPDGSTSIRPPDSVRVSFLDADTLEGRGGTLSNHAPDLASLGTVVQVPLKLDPPSASPLPLRPPLGRAQRRVNFGDASIVVPKTWAVLPPGGTLCAEHLVQLGEPGTKSSCSTPPGHGKLTTVSIQALPPDFSTTAWPKATVQYLNGHRVIRLTPTTMGVTQGTVKYAVRDLGVELSMSGAGTEEVISSIDWSDRHVALRVRARQRRAAHARLADDALRRHLVPGAPDVPTDTDSIHRVDADLVHDTRAPRCGGRRAGLIERPTRVLPIQRTGPGSRRGRRGLDPARRRRSAPQVARTGPVEDRLGPGVGRR